MHRSVARGIAIILAAVVIIVVMFLLPGPSHKRPHPPNLDPWVLVSYDPGSNYGTYLGNGHIATRIRGEGVGHHGRQPLPCFMAGLYVGEKLVPTPTWSDLRLYSDGEEFKIDKHEPYKQSLDMRAGVLVTQATWRAGRKTLDGAIEVVVSRAQPNVAMIFGAFTANFDGTVRIVAPMHKAGCPIPLLTSGYDRLAGMEKPALIAMFVDTKVGSTPDPPIGVVVGSYLLSEAEIGCGWNRRRLSHYIDVRVNRDYKFMVRRYAYVRVIDWEHYHHSQSSSQRPLVPGRLPELEKAVRLGADFRKQHVDAWAKLWEADIVIDGPPKDQQAIHSCMFYLLQSVREGSEWSIPPMGLSDNAFSGHVFWDADTWMFPALILQHPELARSIVDYRFRTLPGAMRNTPSHLKGAQYAWESGKTGIEDTPSGLVYRHERHINGDVALAQWQYYLATGDLAWLKERGWPVIEGTAEYWASRVTFNKEKGLYEIRQVVPPDENANLVNNSVYTNAIAQMNLRIAIEAAKLVGKPANPKWRELSDRMYIPFDGKNKRFVAHDDYKGFKAKQADVELLIYPLQFALPGVDMDPVYRNTFDYYAPKVMPIGPAMSASAHSVIAARLGDCKKAYAKFVDSYKPFLRGPFNYFNEKQSRSYENMCFLTGAAGPIQAAIFGIAGARMDYFPADPTKAELTFKPCLPKEWKSLKLTGVQWRGRKFDVRVKPGNKIEIVEQPGKDRAESTSCAGEREGTLPGG